MYFADKNNMYYVYLLHSQKIDKYYIGQTNNLEDRLIRHNGNRCRSTKNKGPWKLVGYKSCYTRYQAVQIERKLKALKKKDKLIKYFLEV